MGERLALSPFFCRIYEMTESTQQPVKMSRFKRVRKNLAAGKYETQFATFGMCLFIGMLFIAVGGIYSKYAAQQNALMTSVKQQEVLLKKIQQQDDLIQSIRQEEELIKDTEQRKEIIRNARQQQELVKIIHDSRKVYVYSLEEVLVKAEALSHKQKFDEEILKLNDELLEAEEKIKKIKDAKVKEDFSDVYLKNLRMKRDELVNNYQNSIKDLTQKINQALAEIAKEKDVPAVFLKSAIAVQTPYVVDLTDEIAERLQKNVEKK